MSNLETVFVLNAKKTGHKGCIVSNDNGKLTFVRWLKPAKYHHNLPNFLREEFTKANRKLLKPIHIQRLPKSFLEIKIKA
jgi:hypothetical protein